MRLKILLVIIFSLHVFFMFYNLIPWANFGWDQVDNAWAAMNILTKHAYPLVGMVAKENSGIYIGPLYYYFVAIFYYFTKLDPIASPLIAGATSLLSFFLIYVVVQKLFDERMAIVSVGIYTFSSFIIASERVQWPVNFIAPLSLLILYFLYRILAGEPKYFIHLATVTGLSFHIHFTSIFYPIIIACSLPFVPWNKRSVQYLALSLPIGAIFFIPQGIYYYHTGLHVFGNYGATFYHGFHLRRVIQLTPDAFIKFQSLLMNPYAWVHYVSFLFVPAFVALRRDRLSLLIALWFVVPWLVFATYSGEISDYYFSLETYVAVIILAYLSIKLWDTRRILARIAILLFWVYWSFTNVYAFFQTKPGSLTKDRAVAKTASETARIINFTEGDPQSYLYYLYMYRRGGWLPYKL